MENNCVNNRFMLNTLPQSVIQSNLLYRPLVYNDNLYLTDTFEYPGHETLHNDNLSTTVILRNLDGDRYGQVVSYYIFISREKMTTARDTMLDVKHQCPII